MGYGATREFELWPGACVGPAGPCKSISGARHYSRYRSRFLIHRDLDFGGLVEAEDTFDGYAIPTRIRIGWHFGSDRFESEGEFFRATVDSARFR